MPVIDDVGSGVLADDLAAAGRRAAGPALGARPARRSSASRGDKLLGGPQAGLIVGRRGGGRARARAHPLARALRLDKLSLAALEATLRLYRDPERARREIPVLAMLTAAEDELRGAGRAAGGADRSAPRSSRRPRGSAAARCRCSSCPGRWWRSRGGAPDALAARLRAGDPPVVGRIEGGRLLLDPRTLADDELEAAGARSPRRAAA